MHKGASTRQGQQQSELKGQNQLLVEANEELQKNYLETQLKVTQLEQQYSDLQGTNADIKKHLKDCHALLVAGNIDPVLGERIGESAPQNEDQQRVVVVRTFTCFFINIVEHCYYLGSFHTRFVWYISFQLWCVYPLSSVRLDCCESIRTLEGTKQRTGVR
uniref:Uncharacterized protein n=1 Tax=Oncorhynchus kisutch TaxID=8019 RepID=A0A8C7I5Y1_ONCKI